MASRRWKTLDLTTDITADLTLAASETKTISEEFVINDPEKMIIDVDVTSFTENTDVNILLQDSYDGGSTWVTRETFNVTGTGNLSNEYDTSTNGLLRQRCRIAAETGTTDALVVAAVRVSYYD